MRLRSVKNLKPPISDVAESFVSVTDIKHYFYCPRIVYFERVLHAKPVLGSQQEDAQEGHEDYVAKELRRKDAIYYSPDFTGAEKRLFVPLSSAKLGLQGVLDLLIRTKQGEYVPVDYKMMPSDKGKVWMDHKYQLTAYALLVEDCYSGCVKRGFINYIPEKLILKVDITPSMKTHVKRVIGHIKRIITEEKLPPAKIAKHKCTGGCGHKQTCQTI
ncbi:CRISPR-associated protein Cas4 [Candidatus Bathyarchaeota archaeon]|nr:CRISPR-associated protein Cas4 [Candidatus Bathyarchaeota archaeon]